jgi:hypothetical protein
MEPTDAIAAGAAVHRANQRTLCVKALSVTATAITIRIVPSSETESVTAVVVDGAVVVIVTRESLIAW